MRKEYGNKQVYFVGGGIASLAGACYLIRDCEFPGESIHIFEELNVMLAILKKDMLSEAEEC